MIITDLSVHTNMVVVGIVLFLALSVLVMLVCGLIASHCVYNGVLRRKSKEKWGREPSALTPQHLEMDAVGMAWHKENLAYKNDVHIVHKGLNLYGEYYDFGKDKCVVLLSGRTESLRYGYYFMKPYQEAGFNALVIDPRAHGLSDGEFNTVGFEESGDVIAWVNFIKDTYNVSSFVFHGICIGAAGSVLALTSDACPKEVKAVVVEGMFSTFGESMKNNLRERKKPVFMIFDMIDMWMKHYTGHSMKKGPIDVIHKIQKPILMIHSKEDTYSVPEIAQKMYDAIPAEGKMITWFDHGRHSMLRITDTERYDAAIGEFLSRCFDEKNEK